MRRHTNQQPTPPERAMRRARIWFAVAIPAAVLWGVAYSIGFPYMGLVPGGWMLFLVLAYQNLGWANGYHAGLLDGVTPTLDRDHHETL